MTEPNILLIVLDATRADACSCYGTKRRTTPMLDKVAENGVLFEQAISPAPWTLPSMASIFTGLYPSQIDVYRQLALDPQYPTLARLLSEKGYGTFCISNNSWLSTDFGLQHGFQRVHRQWQIWQSEHEVNKLVLLERARDTSLAKVIAREVSRGNMVKNVANAAFNRLYAYRQDLGASRIMRPLTRWIDTQAGPWFALVHYLEAHLKYTPPLKWAARFASDLESVKKWRKADQWRAAWRHIAGIELLSEADLRCWRELYEAEVAYADHHMGLLLDWLDQTGRLDDTFVIIVADHGENLGEHGLLNHQYCVYDTLLHVPLVLRYPGALPRGKRIPWQVQTLDIFQTILEAGGVQVLNSPSRSLLAGPPDRSLTVAEYGTPRAPHRSYLDRFGIQRQDLQKYERGFTAIRTESHKLILGTDGSRELYHWPCDHAEEMNLANEQPDLVVELETVLNNWQSELGVSSLAESSAEWEMDPDTASRLEALGYLG